MKSDEKEADAGGEDVEMENDRKEEVRGGRGKRKEGQGEEEGGPPGENPRQFSHMAQVGAGGWRSRFPDVPVKITDSAAFDGMGLRPPATAEGFVAAAQKHAAASCPCSAQRFAFRLFLGGWRHQHQHRHQG